jgi:micrococcal nuclease
LFISFQTKLPYIAINLNNKIMYHYKAKVERVVDGDTFDVVIDLGFKITTNQRIRMAKINTPETYNVKKDSEEYQKGLASNQYMEHRLAANNFLIELETEKATEKYGRYLGTIWLADSSVTLNDEMVEKGFAVYKNYK